MNPECREGGINAASDTALEEFTAIAMNSRKDGAVLLGEGFLPIPIADGAK